MLFFSVMLEKTCQVSFRQRWFANLLVPWAGSAVSVTRRGKGDTHNDCLMIRTARPTHSVLTLGLHSLKKIPKSLKKTTQESLAFNMLPGLTSLRGLLECHVAALS